MLNIYSHAIKDNFCKSGHDHIYTYVTITAFCVNNNVYVAMSYVSCRATPERSRSD